MGHKKKSHKKDSQLLLRIGREERDEFVALCEELDTSAAREIRRFIKKFIADHNAAEASDSNADSTLKTDQIEDALPTDL